VDLAKSVDRGLRSAVGSYGFMQGGLIAEAGKLSGETLASLTARVELPSAWRFVLIRPQGGRGLSGSEEVSAFATLPPVSKEMTARLERILNDELLPATKNSDYERFGDAVYRYGRLAGECFAPCQGGPYASPVLMEIVRWLREHSVPGVGQSSWGPTMFALQPDMASAQRLVEELNEWQDGAFDLQICSVDNQGMRVTQHCNSSSTS
jgi:predicted sugar kinase